ncbi:unnamed protein product [Urochloa decumbens]|uniref:DUF1618 domain-containing protein n=1 Tax=Urochloa decumbens TaxID=240449 RepID=A0ABC9A1F8_9POAL
MSAAGGFPKWVLLEPYVFRRDDDESFPDETEAPIRASGVTTCGTQFRIAFSVAEPPHISRLYAQLPGFPGPDKATPLAMLATHRRLALLVLIGPMPPSKFDTKPPCKFSLQNFFILRADVSSSLKALPPCTEPRYDYSGGGDSLRPRPCKATPRPRMLDMRSLGLWCGGGDNQEEFVVAELTVSTLNRGRRCTNAFADICFLRASADSDRLGGAWRSMRVEILDQGNPAALHDLWKLARWQTHAVIPFQQWLCWIDYQKGILFCDLCNKEPAAPSFLWFPPLTSTHETTRNDNIFYGGGGVSVVDRGRALKFVNVTRHDGLSDFTITYHTLMLGDGTMAWKEDYTVTSNDLPADSLPLGNPMFPQVDIVRPHVVHFLFIEFGLGAYEKMSVLSIDMSTNTVESFYPYVDGNEYLQADDDECPPTDDPHFIMRKSLSPPSTPFLPCEFPRFCYLSRKRKNMD